MKKTSLIIIAVLLTIILSTGTIFAETSGSTVNLTLGQSKAQINGQDVRMAGPARIVSGRTLVPLRFIGEAFGCEVNWAGAAKTAVVTLENEKIEVPVGQNYVVINGEKVAVEVPGQLINGSTYVPLRFLGETLGAKVDYDKITKEITLVMNTYKNKANDLEIVLPAGWTVDAEAAKGISLTNGTEGEALLALVETEDGVSAANMDVAALFEKESTKEGFQSKVNTNTIVASYTEDGVKNLITYEFLDSGVYLLWFSAPVDSFHSAFSSQCELMVNTLKTY